MQYSTNNRLKLPEGTDNVRRQDFVDNFNIIDNGLTKFYVATLDSINTYKITTGNSLTALNNGYSVKVAIPSDSSGAVSIKVDSVTVAVKKPNGSAVTNFKQNAVYSLVYYNSVFILASGGGTDDVNFTSSKLLTGYSANDSNGEKVDGTMPNKGTVTQSLSANGTINLGLGYYDSIKITQSLPTKGATTWKPSTKAQSIPSGTYLTGTQTIEGDTNLAPQNIRAGVSIFGVGGAVTIESLGGYSKQEIKNKVIVTRYKVVKQSETALNLNGKSNMMYEVLQKYVGYVRSSGDEICEVFCIDNNLNNLIFVKSKGTASSSHNKDYYHYLQYVNFNTFTTTSYESNTYLPLDQVGSGKKYHSIPLEGNTKYGKLVISEFRHGDSSGNSYCYESTIRLKTTALTYDLLTLPHYGWLFNYSSSSDAFTTIEDRKEGSKHIQYKVTYKIVPEVVDKDGNVIS